MRPRSYSAVLLIILFTTSNLLAQKIFREGYIEKKSGETLNGLIEYSAKRITPSNCRFKRFEIAYEAIYSADEIKAFGYKNGNRFEAKEYNSKTSFYELIVYGKIILYVKDSDYFIEKGNSGLVPLKKTPISFLVNGYKTEYQSVSEFLRQITEGKIKIPDKIDMKAHLVPLIAEYDGLAGEDSKVYNRSMSYALVEKMAINSGMNRNNFGIISGASMYILFMEMDPTGYVPAPARETCPQLGLVYERTLSRRNDKLSANVELLFFKQTFYTYSEDANLTRIIRNDSYYGFTAFKIPGMLRYSLKDGKFTPFVNAGLAYQYIIDHNFNHVQEIEYLNSHEVMTDENQDFLFKPQEISFLAGIGVKTRLSRGIFVNLQCRIEYGEGIFKNPSAAFKNFKAKSIQPSLLMGITF